MGSWWHRLWCSECRILRPVDVEALPNDYPLSIPTLYILKSILPEFLECPIARAKARDTWEKTIAAR